MKTKTIILSIIAVLALTGCESEQDLNLEEISYENTAVEDVVVENENADELLDTDFSTNEFGSLGALEDEDFTIEEMLVYAIQDEFAARAEYEYILNEFDVNTPFSNIIKSEETHIELLLPLFDAYELDVPEDTSSEHLIEITSLVDTYATGVLAEELNIAMYNLFLEQDDLPEDLVDAFTKLRDASMNHLSAFQKNLDKY